MNAQSRLFDFLYHQLQHFPQPNSLNSKEASQWKSISTHSLADTVNRLSAGLLRLGLYAHDFSVEKQDKIAIISKNRPEWLMLDLATQQIGVLLCPIYPTTHPNEIEFIFKDAEVKHVFVSGQELADKVNAIRPNVQSLQNVYSFDADTTQTLFWETLLADITDEELQQVEVIKQQIKPEHCVTIIYTSGTTGTPKGVMLSHHNLVTNVLNATASFPFPEQPGARALSFLPLNHIFERMASYIYMYTGICIYYAESLETIGENLKEVKPTLFTTVPRLLEKMYDKIMAKGSELTGIKKKLFFWSVGLAERYQKPGTDSMGYRMQLAIANALVFKKWREALGGKIEYVITGGAAAQEKLLRIFNAAKIPIYEGYGPTENSPVISVNCRKSGGTKFGTVGLVIDGQEVKLEADGEICVKGPSVMMGYYKRPDLTAEVLIDGWLHTGDIGVWVDDKYLKITDRKKEMFKTSGGKYVAPQPIENKLKESPFIEQTMVLGSDRKFVSALIVPAFPHLKMEAAKMGIASDDPASLVNHPQIISLYKSVVESYNQHFNHVEQVRKFRLLEEEWSVNTGEMTPKLSMRRKVIHEKYQAHIEAIYTEQSQ